MGYLVAALILVVVVLAFACRRLWLASQSRGLQEFISAQQEDLHATKSLLLDQLQVVMQVGELLDHAGVDLERGPFSQESKDLKTLGSIMRQWGARADRHLLEEAQPVLRELGERYGIEPRSGGPYCLRNAVRIAEEIIERALELKGA